MREAQNKATVKWRAIAKNKEVMNEKQRNKNKTVVICECGTMSTKGNITRHRKNAKHLRLMTSHEQA